MRIRKLRYRHENFEQINCVYFDQLDFQVWAPILMPNWYINWQCEKYINKHGGQKLRAKLSSGL